MKIFIADYLPLLNKGEEEILRGIESLFEDYCRKNIHFCVFGDVDQKREIGNVTVFPKDICYPDLQGPSTIKTVIGMGLALLGCIGFYPSTKKLLRDKSLIREMSSSDLILLGHDGFFNLRCAMLGNQLQKMGLKYAVIGAGFSQPNKKIAWLYNKVYARFFNNSMYIILRERTAYNYVCSISNNSIIELLPDPAFYCPDNKYNFETIKTVVYKYNIHDDTIKVGLTVCEDSISFAHAFIDSPDRIASHRDFIKNVITNINDRYKCTFYFLPHCIKEGRGNDLNIAKYIKHILPSEIECYIIEEDLPVLDLKKIISEMDIVIGERTHSIINSISTLTPFVSLTCSADFRTHDIVGDGCGIPEQIVDLDYPDINYTVGLINKTIENGSDIVKKLKAIHDKQQLLKTRFQEIIWN